MAVKIKVLHIIKTLNFGGAESNLLNLVRFIDTQRFETFVAYSSIGELEEAFIKAGVQTFKFSEQAHKIASFQSFSSIRNLVRFIRQNKIDVVHTHTFNAHMWGSAAAKLTGCKILEHVHDSRYMDPVEFERRGEKSQQYRFTKYLRNISDMVVVLTKQNKEFIEKEDLHPNNRVLEIQNGLDFTQSSEYSLEQIRAFKTQWDIPVDAKIVLTPIRFSPEKNLNILFEIIAKVVQTRPDVVCVIAGSGPEKAHFEKRVSTLNLTSRIKTIGFHSDIPGLLSFTDVFLLPSTIELHSIAIIEAMRQKVPVVVSQGVGCNDEFIENWKNGILLNPFSNEGWVEAILKLLNDPMLKNEIGENGYRTCLEKFDIRDIVKKFENIYVQLSSS